MRRVFVLLAVALLVFIGSFAVLVSRAEMSTRIAIILCVVCLTVLLFRGNAPHLAARETRRQADIREKSRELLEQATRPQFKLHIRGSVARDVLAGLLLLAMGVGSLAAAMTEGIWPAVLLLAIGAGSFFASVMFLWAACLKVKAHLELSSAGVWSPLHGLIPWQAIDGVCLQDHSRRGITRHVLMLRVPELKKLLSAHGVFGRALLRLQPLLRRRPHIASIDLIRTDTAPDAVYALTRKMWSHHTKLQHDWNPEFSDACNEMERALAIQEAQTALANDENDIRTALQTPERTLEKFRTFQVVQAQRFALREQESRRILKRKIAALLLMSGAIAILFISTT